MLKLSQLFFINFLLLFIGTLLFSGVATYFAIKNIELENFEKRLQEVVELSQFILQKSTDFQESANSIYQKTDARFTLINEGGMVVAESNKDKEYMENHKDRPEIQEAQEKKYGKSIRSSASVGIDFLYLAKKIEINSKIYFARAAMDVDKIMDDFYSLWLKITIIFGVSIAIGLAFSYKTNKNIKREIDKISVFLINLSNKNYTQEIWANYTDEFGQISKILNKLSKKLEKKEKQKRKYNAKLRLVNMQRSQMISAISHEFKNPIATIMGYAQTINEDKNINPTIRGKFLEKIYQNSQKLSFMIDRISMSVRLENDDFRPKFSTFEPVVPIDEIKNSLLEKYKNREINIKIDDENIKINADKTLFEMVMTNLMENALKYSTEDVVVWIAMDKICVIDRGIGIEQEDIQKITKKFYRVNENTWESSMGIGLFLVEYILKLHQTHLEITSVPLEGSSFCFEIKKLIFAPPPSSPLSLF